MDILAGVWGCSWEEGENGGIGEEEEGTGGRAVVTKVQKLALEKRCRI